MTRIICIISLVALATLSFGQGCSDAGFCTMGAMKPSQIYTKKINFKLRAIDVSYYEGSTHLTPTIRAVTTDFTFGIDERTNMQIKLPYQFVKGSLGSTSALGDISLSVTRNLYSTENFHVNATLGGKIPTNNSDLDDASTEFTTFGEEATLPMYYQTSLGSYDIVAGASLNSKKWLFATGVQIALTKNENDFRYRDWDNYPDPEYVRDYDLATNLKRGTDIMFRVERAFHFAKVDIRLGLLPIYRISKDKILDLDINSDTFGERIKLDNTTGLALTTLLNVSYHFNVYNSLNFMYGLKLLDRDVNPDGLTRENVLSLGYTIRF